MLSYKILSYSEWLLSYKELYPYARSNLTNTEVVLSCIEGEGDLTRDQALDYIRSNWIEEEENEPNDTE